MARTLHQLTRGPATIENNQRIQLVRHDSPKVASILVLNPSYDILVQPRCMSLASYIVIVVSVVARLRQVKGLWGVTVGEYMLAGGHTLSMYLKTPLLPADILSLSFVLWPLRMTLSNFHRFMAHPTHAFVLVLLRANLSVNWNVIENTFPGSER